MQTFQRKIFYISLLALSALGFGYLGHKELLPFHKLEAAFADTSDYFKKIVGKRPPGLKPIHYPGKGVTVYDENRVQQGYTLLQGWFSDGVKIKLISLEGKLINQWDVDFFELWQNPEQTFKNKKIPGSAYDFHSQGMHLYPDGSLLFNLSQFGLVKVDLCGSLIWKMEGNVHHSISVDKHGNIWVPANRNNKDVEENLKFTRYQEKVSDSSGVSLYENLILEVNESGQLVKELSVLKSLLEAGIENSLFESLLLQPDDPLHLNDIEFVNEELARKLDGVEEGDLLVSLRNVHMLAILSREDGRLLWYQIGPWVRQHDPDISQEGGITLFNNRSLVLERKQMKPFSSILGFEPGGRAVSRLLPELEFFSSFMGSHQVLANGNILITESVRGRVLEVDEGGEIVWEYIEPFDKKYAAIIADSKRFEEDFFTVDDWACSK